MPGRGGSWHEAPEAGSNISTVFMVQNLPPGELKLAPPVTRSRSLIEGKRTVSYGEIMNGGPLGENPYFEYHPHDSFDDKGYLKVESYKATIY